MKRVPMSKRSLAAAALVLLTHGCAGAPAADTAATVPPPAPGTRPPTAEAPAAESPSDDDVRRVLGALAHDSLRGRRTGTAGARGAARLIAQEMLDIGLVAAGNEAAIGPGGRANAYLQRVPLARTEAGRLSVILTAEAADTIAADRIVADANVVGMIPGSDPALKDEAVIVGAHYDHVGVGRAVDGDSIYNGADDDASGVVAMLEIARALRAGPAAKRTVVFVAFAGEEMGGLGARYYLANPVVPIDRTVAQLQIEMIALPDTALDGSGQAWLTGYERSTMGDVLAQNGVPIVADPRPAQNFFQRSDNIRFARAGIPAHTLSTFDPENGAHYHQPSDEVDSVDFEHMRAVIASAIQAVRLLADGPRPAWKPGGRPTG
jgi:hypothetical protein